MQRRRSAIGLDIGDHAVKCVQLEQDTGPLRVLEACYVPLKSGSEEGTDRRERTLTAARRALRNGDFHGRKCLSALRLFETTTRHVRIPASEMQQASEALARELQETESEPTAGLAYQYEQVAELVEHGERQCEYLCCIADPLIVREHLDMLARLGLQPVAIDLDACAQIRPFVGADPDDGSMSLTVDLGCRCTRLIIVRGSRPIMMRTVAVGGANFIQVLERKLQLDYGTARDLTEACRNCAGGELDDLKLAISRTLSDQLDLIVSRINECARYAATLFGGQAVDRMHVLGGAAALPGVVDYLERNLGVPAAGGDPFLALGLEPPRTSRSIAPATFATALGLALRGMAA